MREGVGKGAAKVHLLFTVFLLGLLVSVAIDNYYQTKR